jgi:hypothetical protein
MDMESGEGIAEPSKKISHTGPGFGGGSEVPLGGSGTPVPLGGDNAPMPMAESTTGAAPKQIRAFEKASRHTEKWKRQPNVTGEGASHVRTFHAKLTAEALVYMDQVINEWLDEHPEYEVKRVTSTVGILTGKLKEPHIICQVWV